MNSEQKMFLLLGSWNDLTEIMNKGLNPIHDEEFITLIIDKSITQLKILKEMDESLLKKFIKETNFSFVLSSFLIKFPKINKFKAYELFSHIIYFMKNTKISLVKYNILEVLYLKNENKKIDILMFKFISSLFKDDENWVLSESMNRIVQVLKERNPLMGGSLEKIIYKKQQLKRDAIKTVN